MFDHGFPSDWSTIKKLIWLKGAGIIGGASAIWKTVTGTLIHITDALASPTQKFEVTLEPVQSGSGDPSPTNVRPITGWTGTAVNVTGVNLWDEEWELGDISSTTGQKTADNNRFRSKNYIPVLPSTTYYCQTGNYDVIKRMAFYDADKTYLGTSTGWIVMPDGTITTPANAYYALFFVATPTYNNDISINYPSTDTSYHAYNGTTYSVTFPALGKNLCNPDDLTQVYTTATNIRNGFEFSKPGTYVISASDYNSGSIRIKVRFADGTFTAASIVSDSETKTYKKTSLQENEAIIIYDNSSTNTIEQSKALFEAAKIQLEVGSSATSYEPYTNTVYGCTYDFVSGGLKPYKEYDSYNGETLTGEWMSSMDKYVAGTTPTIGAQVVDLDGFETTVQLTPQPISTLADENNVWGDGSIEMTYKARG